MLIKTEEVKDGEMCLFDSENIFKSVYYPSKKALLIYFIRKKRSRTPIKEADTTKKIVVDEGMGYIEGSVYNILNVDEKTYTDFKNAESQGRHYNSTIAKDPKFFVSGKFDMFASEIKEVVEQAGKADKGFLF